MQRNLGCGVEKTRICDKKTSGSGQKAIGGGGAKIKVNQGRENNAK